MKLLPRAKAVVDQATSLALEQVERLLAGLQRFTSKLDGLVPASGGGTLNFLRADGSWSNPVGTGAGVSSVTAGSSKVTASPTTGPVVVDVVPGNFTGIPEAGVTNLTTDLSTRPTGSGTNNTLAKWTGTSALGNSSITDDGSKVTVPEPLVSTNATAGAEMHKFLGKDVLGNTDNTNGPVFMIAISTTGRRDLMLVDSANEAVNGSNLALDLSVGTAQGCYLQAVNTNWTTGQALGINIFGGAVTMGRGAAFETVTVNAPFACTGLVDLTGQSVYLGRQVLSAASGTYTPTTGTRKVLVRGVGGGGGGGGAVTGTGVAAAGGGGSGFYFEKWINPGATVTGGAYHAGAGGGGGAAGNNPGTAGNQSDIIINGTLYTMKGGNGGGGSANTTTALANAGGAVTAGSSVGDEGTQQGGYTGWTIGGGVVLGMGGTGGSCPTGGGGIGVASVGTGAAGQGNGGGGAGAVATNASQAGGAGSAGLIIVDEWR